LQIIFCVYLFFKAVLIDGITKANDRLSCASSCSFSSFIFELGTLKAKNTYKTKSN